MKAKKPLLVGSLLLLAASFWIFAFYSNPRESTTSELGQTYYDSAPLSHVNLHAFALGAIFFIACIIIISIPNDKRVGVALLAFVILFSVMPISTSQSRANGQHWRLYVNVLVAVDEEFEASDYTLTTIRDAIHQANSYMNPWAIYDCFEDTFSLHFEIIGYTTFTSDRGHNYWGEVIPDKMAIEILTEIGEPYGNLTFNGIEVDVICAVTGEDLAGVYCCAYPDASLVLLEMGLHANYMIIRHEFSHLFYVPDSTHVPCVMNFDCVFHIPPKGDWCDECEEIFVKNRMRYRRIFSWNGHHYHRHSSYKENTPYIHTYNRIRLVIYAHRMGYEL